MNRIFTLITLAALLSTPMLAQTVATDSVAQTQAVEIPVWRQKLYYGYNIDIY